VVIAARNEAANIAECIASLQWVDEIIVAEQDSTDQTVELAHTHGATVIHPFAPTIGLQRNAAIAQATNAWVLVVDADERATPALAAAVARTITQATQSTYRVARQNFFLGRAIRHGGWQYDRPVRLFRQTHRYNDSKVHEHVIVTAEPGMLSESLLHYPYASLNHYFEKFNRYSAWWADQQYDRGRRTNALAVVCKPPARFFSMYVLRLGFLDGAHGMILAALAAASVLAKYARLWGKQREQTCAS
jgi:glycosyltransferase involved in cell wall biosynthesis